MSYILLVILNVVLVLLIKFALTKHKQPPNLPPGPPRVPIIGSIPFLPKKFRIKGRGLHTPKLFQYLTQKYGSVSYVWLGPVPTIVISGIKN